jgi:hypothetical protein
VEELLVLHLGGEDASAASPSVPASPAAERAADRSRRVSKPASFVARHWCS